MYKAGVSKSKPKVSRWVKKGSRNHPDHPMYGTSRILVAVSKHPSSVNVESNNEAD